MNPQVSRALARYRHVLRLGPTATRELVDEFGSAASIDDLPAWITELSDGVEPVTNSAFFARVLASRRLLNHPGHADQSSHGRKKKGTEPPTEDMAGSGKVGPKASGLGSVDNPGDIRAQAMGANPNYGGPYRGPVTAEVRRGGVSYTQNCTRVAIAYEMRRRGVDVTAGVGARNGDTTAAYVRTFRDGGRYATRVSEDLGRNMSARQVATEVESWPRGARGIVTVSGHTFNVERNPTTGKATFVDAQAASKKSPVMDSAAMTRRMRARGASTDERMAVARVDDLDVSDYGLRYVESSKLDIANGQIGKSDFPTPDPGRRASIEEINAMTPDDSYP